VVAHIRKKDYSAEMMEPSQMQLRKLFFSEDGWPYTAPQPYRGELQTQISEEELIGFYERVDLVPTLPQGISTATPMRLGADGYYEHCSIQGSWNLLDKQRIAITYGPHREEARFLRIYDTEREVETIGLCGISEDGICFWAKKVSK
jgi:arabinan endo-1,5-alpha-L-arabinosidase